MNAARSDAESGDSGNPGSTLIAKEMEQVGWITVIYEVGGECDEVLFMRTAIGDDALVQRLSDRAYQGAAWPRAA